MDPDTIRKVGIPSASKRYGNGIPMFSDGSLEDLQAYNTPLPINPAADEKKAKELSISWDPIAIQNYLDSIGVTHFNSMEIYNYSPENVFFWLTRFSGPKPFDIEKQAVYNGILQKCKNISARDIILGIQDLSELIKVSVEMNKIVSILNEKDGINQLMINLGITSYIRLQRSFDSYLKLLSRPILTPFKIGMARDINRPLTEEDIQYYTDSEIEAVIGPQMADTRPQFLHQAVQRMNTKKAFLLTKDNCLLCQNERDPIDQIPFQDLNETYIGIGVLSIGLRCYRIQSLLNALESFRDSNGLYTFVDPLSADGRITEEDLVLVSELPIPQNVEFKRYLNIYRKQLSTTQNWLDILSQFSKSNTEDIRFLFLNLFWAGLYMRQWKGPGYPYPYNRISTGSATYLAPEEFEEKIKYHLREFDRIFHTFPSEIQGIINELPYKTYFLGEFSSQPNNIRTYIDDIELGRACIRSSSAPTIYTAVYYIRKIIGEEEIPDLNITAKRFVDII